MALLHKIFFHYVSEPASPYYFRVTIDSRVTFDKHIDNICQASYLHIRALRHGRCSMTTDIAKSVASAIINARLHYCNSPLLEVSVTNKKYNAFRILRFASSQATKIVSILHRFSQHFIGYQLPLELRIRC